MAFDITNLARITMAGQSVAPALYSYGTTDNYATASASGYFNAISANLNVGDEIFLKASDSNLIVQVTAVLPNVTVAVLSNYAGALNNGSIFIGNGSNVATAQTMSGDATLSNAGVLTVGQTLDGGNAANTAAGSVLGGLPVVHQIAVAGGAGANYDIILTNKSVVIDAWIQVNAAGTTNDTIQIFNGATGITNAMSAAGADTTIVRAGTINDASATINAGGTLRATQVDGGGSDSPPCTVYVMVLHVA